MDNPKPVELVIGRIYRYERLAPVFKALYEQGVSVVSLASAHGMSWEYANQVLEFYKTGKPPIWKKPGKTTGAKAGTPPKYILISAEVARLREKQKLSWHAIVCWLQEHGKGRVAISTVRRAYDYAHRSAIRTMVDKGKKPSRGTFSRLGEVKYMKIRRLLQAGKKPHSKSLPRSVAVGAQYIAKRRAYLAVVRPSRPKPMSSMLRERSDLSQRFRLWLS